MNIFDKFNTNDYDEQIVLKNHDRYYSFEEIKHLVFAQMIEFKKNEFSNVVLSSFDNFNFIINFLAAVFTGKEILLMEDKHKLAEIYFEYFLPEDTIDVASDYISFKKINPDEIHVSFYTSGTTAEPKHIRKSLRNLVTEAEDIYKEFPSLLDTGMIFTTTTKLSHLFGLTFQFMVPFCNGFIIDCGQITKPEQIDTPDAVFISTPSFLEKIAKHNIKAPVIPKVIFAAGDKLKDETFKYFSDKCHVVEIYGSTETGIVAYRTDYRCPSLHKFSNVKIRTDDTGQIIVNSNYFHQPEMSVGDMIEIIDKDNFILLNRIDRLMKIQEKRVSAVELEERLNNHSLIENAYCFKAGDKLAAAIVLNSDGENHLIQHGNLNLIRMLKSYIGNYSEVVPQKWQFLSEIPMEETGKVDKELLREIFEKP